MGSTKAVHTTTVVAMIITTLCMFIMSYLVHDVNNFHENTIVELNEFKEYFCCFFRHLIVNIIMTLLFQDVANSAWYSIRSDQNVLKHKRQTQLSQNFQLPPQCECAAQPITCPAGLSGPPGLMGMPGNDGLPGQPDKRGNGGIQISKLGGAGGCVKCPDGPRGSSGLDKPGGLPGKQESQGNQERLEK
ncbi:hypothetical protein KIN20_020741 [Parelaphostrongylus tenuis]|uniref:Nematode cuticle collagen N-terminal domain-containing protein n=1 Tax=Parelaphostrongylus tenuis TaxID=148309 RepID=A0AAD5QTT5_PARTN|nr:hypothetical protein KIN20_020741 [Parelaphostrongylus tenuis]